MRRILLFALVVAATAPAAAAATIVMLPFDNISGAEQATGASSFHFEKALTDRGWTVVKGDAVETILEQKRVRYLDSLDDEAREEMMSKLAADAILCVTIEAWHEDETPLVAASARAVARDGKVLWSDAVAISSLDTERVLDLGRQTTIKQIAETAIRRLMRGFPRAGQQGAPVRGPASPFGRPITYRSASLAPTDRMRVCVLPIDPRDAPPDAARIVGDLLAVRLAASKQFEVVEPAALRAAAREASIRSFRGIGSNDLAALAAKVGTSLFLSGTIYTWREPPPRATRAVPEFQLSLSVVDVKTGRIVWAANHGRKGDAYEGLFLLGTVTNIEALVDRVISEMIAAEEHAKPRRVPDVTEKTKGKDHS